MYIQYGHLVLADNEASIVILSSIQSGMNEYSGKTCDRFEGIYRDEETNILAPGLALFFLLYTTSI